VQPKAIHLNGKPLGSGRFPVICAPLVGRTREQLLAEAATVAAKKPDLLEWRVDFFQDIADSAAVVELAGRIKEVTGGMPLLFTRRSSREGGEKIALSEDQVVELYRAVCESGQVDLVDFEMGNDAAQVRRVREFSRASGVQLVLSFHDFQQTPGVEFLNQRYAQAQSLGADIAKVAVMPRNMDDVLTLLAATLQSSRTLTIPLIGMSMGGPGAISRLCGWAFGSALTFAVGETASAPGQLPIEDLEAGLAVLRKAIGPVI
jgi:3-dehydroquinate dehydratase-1